MENAFIQAAVNAQFPHWVRTTGQHILNNYDVLDVEREFIFPLENPNTTGESKSFVEAGKIDLILRHKVSKLVCVGEHKTTMEDIDPAGDYWHGLKMDTQVSKYVIASQVLYPNSGIGPVFYDVCRKPGQRPGSVPLVDEDGVKIVVDANGERVKTKDGKKWRESASSADGYVLRTRPETPEEYGARIAEAMAENPSKYFAAKEVPRLASDIDEYRNDAWALSQEILYRRQKSLWPRNPAHCNSFGRCPFWEKCAGLVPPDSGLYAPVAKMNAELAMADEIGGRQTLTQSRLRALRACSRLHYHLYELPIRRVGEDSEALRWGTLWHNALEAWLRPLITSGPVSGSLTQPNLI